MEIQAERPLQGLCLPQTDPGGILSCPSGPVFISFDYFPVVPPSVMYSPFLCPRFYEDGSFLDISSNIKVNRLYALL